MKKYIFITYSIKRVGGVQCYVSAKTDYLERCGWQVYVFCPGLHSPKYPCPISSMNRYINNGLISWLGAPPFALPSYLVRKTKEQMMNVIGGCNSDDEIIIESHEDVYSQWGELLASELGGRHYFYTMNESFRNKDNYYESKIDFYIFKFRRREILGTLSTFTRLFEGYLKVSKEDIVGEMWIDESPIQDVYCEKVENVIRLDYNICYIGRGTKPYVPFIISDVAKFASMHKDKTVQLLTVSNLDPHRELINEVKEANPNLHIIELGFLHPIPQSLYTKVDVVIAGAGSARHSCEIGAMTIVADSETCKSNGLLGYDTLDAVFQDKDSVVTDFCEALERVLVKKVYKDKVSRYPSKQSFETSTLHNFSLYEKSERQKAYYDTKKLLEGRIDWVLILRRYLSDYHPHIVRFIKLFVKTI